MNANLPIYAMRTMEAADQQFAFDGANDCELVDRVWLCGYGCWRLSDLYGVMSYSVAQRNSGGDWEFAWRWARSSGKGDWDVMMREVLTLDRELALVVLGVPAAAGADARGEEPALWVGGT